jgi:5'-deoxynucleotidase YfbR-like HD superfamily hydrolase
MAEHLFDVPFRPPLSTRPSAGHTVAIVSSKWIDPFDMKPEDIDIDDIALALSHICRYNGMVARHYSVAEHSVRVASRIIDIPGFDTPNAQLAALLHDAPEAYIGDIVNPIKRHPSMKWYRDIDDGLMRMIWRHYGVEFDDDLIAAVKQADHAEYLDEWEVRGGDWDAEMACDSFLLMFRRLRRAIEIGDSWSARRFDVV